MKSRETTDITLFVKTSRDDITTWNRQKIIDALIRETNVDMGTAEEVSKAVERQIASSSIGILTTPLIRELVNAKLIERGLDKATKMHGRLGFPLFDVDHLILYKNNENANVPHSPEGTNLILAEGIKREYALLNVFSDEVGYAHLTGDIHLHHLGYIDRAYCSCQSLEYIKKFGLNVPHSLAVAAPAKHAEVLLAHMIRFAAALQGNYSGAIGWLDVNTLFAPYLRGLNDSEVKQLAQMLIYEFAQQAVGRGGQTLFTDIHLHWEVPEYLKHIPAIGPGGRYTGEPYKAYGDDARRFVRALFDVYKKGDASGRPFVFPRPILHLTEQFFELPDYRELLNHVCDAAAEKGNPYFVMDRNGVASLSECGRIAVDCNGGRDDRCCREPWRMRYSAIQNVSINLPRLGYAAEGDDRRFFALLGERMKLVAEAHQQKKYFIEKLLSHGNEGPLSLLTADCDGTPYLRLSQASYLIGIVGLNELAKVHRGRQLHESDEARAFGLQLVKKMKEIADRLSNEYAMKFILEQSPAESTPYRFARLDLKYHSPAAGYAVKGDIARGEVYYTNSVLFDIASSVETMQRVHAEGLLHPLIEGEAISYVWLGGSRPDKEDLAGFIETVFKETTNQQIVFSPEFTTCLACGKTSRGLVGRCPFCGSGEVEGISRITGYYSRVSNLNKGKVAELKDLKDRRTEKV